MTLHAHYGATTRMLEDSKDAHEAHRMSVSERAAAFYTVGSLLNTDWLQRMTSLRRGQLARCRCKRGAVARKRSSRTSSLHLHWSSLESGASEQGEQGQFLDVTD